MKRLATFILLVCASLLVTEAQKFFTVKPGLNLNGACFGIKDKDFEPYVGLQFANFRSNYKDDDSKSLTKVHIFMPYIGSKFIISENESIKTFVNATLFKPFIFGKETVDGEENEDFQDELNEYKILGGELGFGSEYFFSDNFSIGGEFGFRFAHIKDDYKDNSGYEPDNSYTDILDLNMSYVSLSLNFYFLD